MPEILKPSVIPSDDNKRILPIKPWPGDELIHHILTGAMIALGSGDTQSAEKLLEVVLNKQTRNRWIYHCVAAYHLSLLKAKKELPELSLLITSLKANPVYPDALELLIKHDRKAATELVRKATRLGGLEAQDFLSIAKSGIWKHYGPFRNSDDMFNGKDLLDVGARHGFHGIVFLAWGGRCYSATDLAKDSFTIKQLKNQRTLNHDKTPLPFSMKEIAQLNPDRINLTVGESEPSGGGPFDYITLFSVTEHLKPPAKVFAGLCNHLSPKGKIFVTHHNFYCWNGHHAGPKSIAQFTDMIGRGEETALADWAFFEKPLAASLNRLTVDQLRREVEHYFNIQNWRVDYTQLGKGLERLNPEILKKVMPLTIEDILTQSVHMLLECKGS